MYAKTTTTLMIKTHKITGLRYFCKTIYEGDKRLSYKGSGTEWKKHMKKYGRKHVETEIYAEFPTDDPKLVETALKFSLDNNIVKSKEWANLIPENGLDGGREGGFTQTRESNEKRRQSMTGRKFGPMNEETKSKISENKKGVIYSDERNSKISKANAGRSKPKGFGNKVSKAKKGKFVARDLRTGEMYGVTRETFDRYEYLVGANSKKPNWEVKNG